MSGAIFISYRRDDSEGEAGRLYDDLIRVFGAESVFMDVSDIHPGRDFRRAIDDNVSRCAVLLAIIGPDWTKIQDASGARRLDQPNDFVRLEVASALARGIDVIPVLVHGASMPAPADLPENLKDLAYRNCVEITHARWNSDVEAFSRTLRQYVERGDALETRSIRRAISGESDSVNAVPSGSVPEKPQAKASLGFVRIAALSAGVLIAAVAGAGAYVYIHHTIKHHEKEETKASEQAVANLQTANPSSSNANLDNLTQRYLTALSGNWINPDAQNGKPMRVQIGGQGSLASIHLWNLCGGNICDMGQKTAGIHGEGITIDWTGQFSNAGADQIAQQTVAMRMYRIGPALHMIYSNPQTGSTGFDFSRTP